MRRRYSSQRRRRGVTGEKPFGRRPIYARHFRRDIFSRSYRATDPRLIRLRSTLSDVLRPVQDFNYWRDFILRAVPSSEVKRLVDSAEEIWDDITASVMDGAIHMDDVGIGPRSVREALRMTAQGITKFRSLERILATLEGRLKGDLAGAASSMSNAATVYKRNIEKKYKPHLQSLGVGKSARARRG